MEEQGKFRISASGAKVSSDRPENWVTFPRHKERTWEPESYAIHRSLSDSSASEPRNKSKPPEPGNGHEGQGPPPGGPTPLMRRTTLESHEKKKRGRETMNMNKFSYLIMTEEVLNGPLFNFQHFHVSVATASVIRVTQGGK